MTGIGLGTFFILVGVVVGFMIVRQFCQSRASRSWEKTPCRIVASRVVHRSNNYRAEIIYRYHFRDRDYIGDRYELYNFSSRDARGTKTAVLRYPPGLKTFCFVNPAAPDEAILLRRLPSWPYLAGLFPLGFIAGGIMMLLWWAVRRRRLRRTGGLPTTSEESAQAALNPEDYRGGYLRPPRGGEIGMIGAVLGGGAAVVAVIVVVFGQAAGSEWKEVLLWSVAILTVWGVVRTIIAILRPWVRCRLSCLYPRPGKPFWIEWEISHPAAFRQVSLFLEGAEEAISGRERSVKSAVFTVIPVLDTDSGEVEMAGSREITLSPDLMHSFTAYRHRVIWRLVVIGRRRFGMNKVAEYEIGVMPAVVGKGGK